MVRAAVFIGFGEAGGSFATARGRSAFARAYDRLIDADASRAMIEARCLSARVEASRSLAEALRGAAVVLSVVTADQALAAAQAAALLLLPDAFFFDMNSVAPETKRVAAQAVEASGARYFDVAIMAPVDPARLGVPLLVSGGDAEGGAIVPRRLGFAEVRAVGDAVGQASSIKMIRSVMVKGIEALTAKMMLAANAAGVADEVLASLGAGWQQRAEYNLERMVAHGARRAAKMEQAANTLEALGAEPVMTRGTIFRQAEMGSRNAIELA